MGAVLKARARAASLLARWALAGFLAGVGLLPGGRAQASAPAPLHAPAPAPALAPVMVELEVDLRAQIASGRFDPAADQVGVRGSLPPLSWHRSVLARPVGDGRYLATLRFDRRPHGDQPVSYKFHIESARPEAGPRFEGGPNHPLWLKEPGVRIARAFDAPAVAVPPRRTGTIERLGAVASRHVGEREVQVWLPPGYGRDPQRRHPVLYLHDGHKMFDAAGEGAEWQVDETAQRLVEAGAIDAPLIVAVWAAATRVADYTPTAGPLGPPGSPRAGGGAGAYARFLVEELKPLVDARFQTRAEPAATAVGGSSLGGLVSLWLALSRPDVFGAALVVSPSLWWDDEWARRFATTVPLTDGQRPRLWLDMGALESRDGLAQARRLREVLQSRGWRGAALAYFEDPWGTHDEASWAARMEGMLRFLYASGFGPGSRR